MPVFHLHECPPGVLGDRSRGTDVERRFQLDAITDQDERTVEAEERDAQPLLEMKSTKVITGAQRIRQGQDRVSPEVAVVEDGALADAEAA